MALEAAGVRSEDIYRALYNALTTRKREVAERSQTVGASGLVTEVENAERLTFNEVRPKDTES